jgi:hypothetical protein
MFCRSAKAASSCSVSAGLNLAAWPLLASARTSVEARERCESRVYHIVLRGINRQDIFCDQNDYQRFLGTLGRVKTDRFEVYGYCLMSNHIHLLIHEKSEEIY